MSEIRLYLFQSGTQRCKYHDIRMNQGEGSSYEIPVPWFLLTHPRGHVIIDGGLAAEGLANPHAYWGDTVDHYQPLMTEEQGCVAQLGALGIQPEDIRYVLLSHLHSDHTGAIGRFPNALHIVQRQEYDYAFQPDWFTAGAYCRNDFARPNLNWKLLDEDGFDLYGDGTLRCVSTPGHSPGHQSFLVTLASGQAFTLAIDAAYTLDHFYDRALPGLMTSASDAARSVAKLRALTGQHAAKLIPGHDPDVWRQFSLAPAWYE
ncbi:N-acyl homoserine lactonase AttM [Cedecea neteri]|uniref:N-acyl homoserine lactonase AttM n=1 Tax=Cedecea neteri TaxID=158822 RepID=A0A291DZV3_9ENTR|nr:N-acyl homoserine lactonase family protein [Cedecea neteri]ATF93350.1 N-acyl homoserine lactonase family protein [Cedecea neteri]SQC93862.1 N-acyl homoserine lactonase AttM [Cedecea neteri]